MIPGFVTIYIDKDKYKHLYFFPGIDDNDESIYRDIDIPNCPFKYTKTVNEDLSIDYKFFTNKIKKITCNLVTLDGDTTINVLKFDN